MGNEWDYGCLHEIVNFQPKRTIKKGSVAPFIAMADIPGNTKEISVSNPREFQGGGSRFKNGDTLFARITPCLENGKTAKVSGLGKDEIAHGSTEFIVFSPNDPEYDSEYIYYLTRLPEFRKYAETRMEGTSGRQRVAWQALAEYKIHLPSKEERKEIGAFLAGFDEKIELNRRMNETLEAMAQALFKSWFVDFDPVIDNALASGKEIPAELSERAAVRAALGDKRQPLPPEIRTLFPDEFTDSPKLGWIPKGWEVGVVGDILERLNVKKRYKKKDVADHGVVPVYEQGANLLLGYHNGVAEIEAALEAPAFIFGDHTCVTKLSCEPFSISENVIPLKGKKYPTIWVYYAIQGKQSFEEYRRHWMELVIKPIVLPSVELGEAYCVSVKDGLLKNMKLSHQQPVLTRIRDTLLPKLLSGEIRIPDAEKMVEELAL
jgi:type I restriction enzyme, S subunit